MRGGVRICERNKYDYDNHVSFCEAVESVRSSGVDMLFAPCSNNPDVWTDILRIDTFTELSETGQQVQYMFAHCIIWSASD